ncbi:hypothetical protein ACFX19_025532 [Malus domestica]
MVDLGLRCDKHREGETLDRDVDSSHSQTSTLELEEREDDVEDIQKEMADANPRPMKEFVCPIVETSPSCILLDAIARNYELKKYSL